MSKKISSQIHLIPGYNYAVYVIAVYPFSVLQINIVVAFSQQQT